MAAVKEKKAKFTPADLARAAAIVHSSALGREWDGSLSDRWDRVAKVATTAREAAEKGDLSFKVRDMAEGLCMAFLGIDDIDLYAVPSDESIAWECVARALTWCLSGDLESTPFAAGVAEWCQTAARRGAAFRSGETP